MTKEKIVIDVIWILSILIASGISFLFGYYTGIQYMNKTWLYKKKPQTKGK